MKGVIISQDKKSFVRIKYITSAHLLKMYDGHVITVSVSSGDKHIMANYKDDEEKASDSFAKLLEFLLNTDGLETYEM